MHRSLLYYFPQKKKKWGENGRGSMWSLSNLFNYMHVLVKNFILCMLPTLASIMRCYCIKICVGNVHIFTLLHVAVLILIYLCSGKWVSVTLLQFALITGHGAQGAPFWKGTSRESIAWHMHTTIAANTMHFKSKCLYSSTTLSTHILDWVFIFSFEQ